MVAFGLKSGDAQRSLGITSNTPTRDSPGHKSFDAREEELLEKSSAMARRLNQAYRTVDAEETVRDPPVQSGRKREKEIILVKPEPAPFHKTFGGGYAIFEAPSRRPGDTGPTSASVRRAHLV